MRHEPAIMLRRQQDLLHVEVTGAAATVTSGAMLTISDVSDSSDADGDSGSAIGVDAPMQGAELPEHEEMHVRNPSFCYICEEIGQQPAFAVCACSDRYLHLTCQQELMKRTVSHRLGCPICQTAYTNVEMRASNRRLSQEGKRCLAYAFGTICVLGISAYEGVMYAVMPDWSFLAVAVLFALFGIFFIRLGFVLFRRVPLSMVDNVVTIGAPPGHSHSLEVEPPPPRSRARSAPLSPPRRNSVLAAVTQSGLTVLVLPTSPRSRSPLTSPARIAVHPVVDPPLHEIHLNA